MDGFGNERGKRRERGGRKPEPEPGRRVEAEAAEIPEGGRWPALERAHRMQAGKRCEAAFGDRGDQG